MLMLDQSLEFAVQDLVDELPRLGQADAAALRAVAGSTDLADGLLEVLGLPLDDASGL